MTKTTAKTSLKTCCKNYLKKQNNKPELQERKDFLRRSIIQSIFMCLLLKVLFSPITDGMMDKKPMLTPNISMFCELSDEESHIPW